DWVAANLHVIVVFSVLVGGWVANWAMMSIRINDNTERVAKLERRFDRDVVPRQEQEVRDHARPAPGADAAYARSDPAGAARSPQRSRPEQLWPTLRKRSRWCYAMRIPG